MDSYSATADITDKFDSNSNTSENTFDATGGRYGGGAILCEDQDEWVDKVIPLSGTTGTTDELFVAVSFKVTSLTAVSSRGFMGFSQNGDVGGITAVQIDGLWLRINAGNIELYRGSSLIATGSITLSVDVWYRLEIRIVIHGSTGVFQLKINETLDIDFSGDTDDNGALGINVVKLSHQSTVGITSWDDLVIYNSGGAAPNDFLGDMRIETLRPTGAGDSSDSTPSAGTRHEAVDDSGGNDGDSTYVSMDTNDEDLYAMGDLSFTPSAVYAVVTNVVCRADGSTPRVLRGKVKTGTTEGNGMNKEVPFGSNYKTLQDYFPVDPDTATSWTESGVNGMQVGQEVTT
jgi:hypothetical protein